MEGVEKFLFMRPLLNLLAQGRFFCRTISIVLRVGAALVVLFSFATVFQAGKIISDLPASGIPGGILFELFFIVAVYAAVHVLLIRAREVDQLPAGEFSALSLGAVLVRLLGEAYCAFVSLVAIGGGIFVWFTNLSLSKVLNPVIRALFPNMGDDKSFLGGIQFMVVGILTGLAVLILSYVLSELLSLAARYANRDANPQRQNGEQSYKARFG
jgi:uncharacterized membrane protein (DUF485 family)